MCTTRLRSTLLRFSTPFLSLLMVLPASLGCSGDDGGGGGGPAEMMPDVINFPDGGGAPAPEDPGPTPEDPGPAPEDPGPAPQDPAPDPDRPPEPPPISRCDRTPDDALSLHEFESSLEDSVGNHDALLVGGEITYGPGTDDCGEAVEFPDTPGAYVVIPDSPDYDLAVGSLDFWVRFDEPSTDSFMGILSRDALLQEYPGHFTIFRANDGRIVLRIQSDGTSYYVCANQPTPEGLWTHVGVNLGAPAVELYVDGDLAMSTDPIEMTAPFLEEWGTVQGQCGGLTDAGIDGNDNPWVIGVSAIHSAEGEAGPHPGAWFRNGAFDHLRVSTVRREFTPPIVSAPIDGPADPGVGGP